jgi:acetyltransferase-like isoleucine patch superfamily enzyme
VNPSVPAPAPSQRAALRWILAVALLLRLGCILLAPLPPHEGVTRYDDNRYDALAWNLARGQGYRDSSGQPESKDPPLLPALAAGFYRLFGHHRVPVYVAQALLSVVTVGLVFGLARRLSGGGAALLAAALTAVNPDLVVFTNILLTETVFVFLLCAAMLAWERAHEQPTVPRWALTGALLGLATLARPTAQLLIVLVAVLGWRSRSRRRHLAWLLLVAVAAFALTLAPWTVRNYRTFHHFVPVATGAGIGLWVGTNVAWHGLDVRDGASIYADPDFQRAAAGDPFSAERRMLRESAARVLHDPVAVLRLVPGKLVQMLRPGAWLGMYFPPGDRDRIPFLVLLVLLYYPVLLLAVAGSALTAVRSPASRPRLLRTWTPLAYVGLLTLATIPARRYLLPTIPFLDVLAGMALAGLATVARRRLPPPIGAAGAHRAGIRARLRTLEGRARARRWAVLRRGVEVGARVWVGRGCRLIVEPGGRLVLGDGCTVDDGSTLAVSSGGRLWLGAGCFVGHHATLAARQSVELGAGAFLAEMVSVRDHDHQVGRPPSSGAFEVAPVRVGADAWLGAKVTVLRGARVGDRAVVGANAVVRGELPGDAVAVGLPARVVRTVGPSGPIDLRSPSPGAPSPGAPSSGAPSSGTPAPGAAAPGAPTPGAPTPGGRP